MNPSQILIAEDESIVALDIQEALKTGPYDVTGVAGSGKEAVQKALEGRPDLVLMDIHLKGDMDGVQAAREIRERLDIPVIYLTAYSDERTLQRAKMTEPHGYILKPFEKEDLQSSIEMALHKHRSERAVKESRRWLETILRSTGDAVVATDARGFVTFMNPVAERLTGVPGRWAEGPLWMETVRLSDAEGRTPPPALDRAFRDGTAAEFPPGTEIKGPEGPRPVDGVLTPARDEKGRLTGFVLAFRDGTARRRMEEGLKQDNRELERRVQSRTDTLARTHVELQRQVREVDALYKYAPCGYHSLDRDGVVVRMNQTELNWLGLKAEQVVGRKRFEDLLAPSCRERYKENAALFRQRGWLRDVEYELRREDGSDLPVLLNPAGMKEPGGYVMAKVSVYDISERKHAERSKEESQTKFRCITDSAAEGILQTDDKGVIVYANGSALRLFGLAEGEMLGRPADALVSDRHRKRFQSLVRSVQSLPPGASTGPLTGLAGRDKEGREFPVEVSIGSWMEEGQRHFAAILRDVSERKRLEGALMHAGKLSAMGQMAAGLAHELKTPLGTIFSFSDVLLAKPRDKEMASALDTIRRQAMRCATLIDNLLDFARIHKASASETTEVEEAVESALSLVASHAKTRRVTVQRETAQQPFTVRGAKTMLEQVVVNLCMNAIDAMPDGGALTVRTAAAQWRGAPAARIEVSDTGTGVAPEIRERLFEPFHTTKGAGRGTGLGLWLTREIVTGSGGEVSCESAPGKGSTFTVFLPLAEPVQPAEAAS